MIQKGIDVKKNDLCRSESYLVLKTTTSLIVNLVLYGHTLVSMGAVTDC